MNQYEAIDAVYPPYNPPGTEPRLITGKVTLPENNSLDDTNPTTDMGDSSIQRYWNTINDAYDGI